MTTETIKGIRIFNCLANVSFFYQQICWFLKVELFSTGNDSHPCH